MRRLSRFSCCLILLVECALLAREAGAAPRIACKKPVYEFGAVDNTQSVKHTFIISNEGSAPLKIGRIRACCGASAKIASKLIEPGADTTFEVNLSLSRRKGKQRKSFYVGSNDPKQPYLQVRMMGTAVAMVDVAPRSVGFGRMTPGKVLDQDVRIVCQTNYTFTITNIVSTAKYFEATLRESKGGSHHCVSVRTAPPFPPGVTRGRIRIFTDSPKTPRIDVHVSARISSDIVVVPKEILLSEAGAKPEPVTRLMALRSRSKKAFKILEIKTPDPEIKVKIDALAGGGYRCELKNIMPFPDLHEKNIIVLTDHKEMKEVVIPIRVKPRG